MNPVLGKTLLLAVLALNGVFSTNNTEPLTQVKLTLVFDMDLSLAFATTSFLETYKGLRSTEWVPATMGRRTIYVWPRKDAVKYLQEAAQLYNLVVVTHSPKEYADAVLSVLDPHGNIRFRFYEGDQDIVEYKHEGKKRFVVKNIPSILTRIRLGEAQPQVNVKATVNTGYGTEQIAKEPLTQDPSVKEKVPESSEQVEQGTDGESENPEQEPVNTGKVPKVIEAVHQDIRNTFLFENSLFIEDSASCTLKCPNNAFLTSEWHGLLNEVDKYPLQDLFGVIAELQNWRNNGKDIKDFEPLMDHRKRIRAEVHEQLGEYYREIAAKHTVTARSLQTLVDEAYPPPDNINLLAPYPGEKSLEPTSRGPIPPGDTSDGPPTPPNNSGTPLATNTGTPVVGRRRIAHSRGDRETVSPEMRKAALSAKPNQTTPGPQPPT